MHHRIALMSSLVGAVLLGGIAQAAVAAEASAAPVTTQTKVNATHKAPAPKAQLGSTKVNAKITAPGGKVDPKLKKAMLKIKPFSKAQWLDKGRALGVVQAAEGVRGTVAVSPRHPWLDARTYMRANNPMMLRPEGGPDGVMTLTRDRGSVVMVNFRARAGSDYLVDCAIPREGSYRVTQYSTQGWHDGSASVSSGHLTIAVGEHASRRDMQISISGEREYSVGRCEITEVR